MVKELSINKLAVWELRGTIDAGDRAVKCSTGSRRYQHLPDNIKQLITPRVKLKDVGINELLIINKAVVAHVPDMAGKLNMVDSQESFIHTTPPQIMPSRNWPPPFNLASSQTTYGLAVYLANNALSVGRHTGSKIVIEPRIRGTGLTNQVHSNQMWYIMTWSDLFGTSIAEHELAFGKRKKATQYMVPVKPVPVKHHKAILQAIANCGVDLEPLKTFIK